MKDRSVDLFVLRAYRAEEGSLLWRHRAEEVDKAEWHGGDLDKAAQLHNIVQSHTRRVAEEIFTRCAKKSRTSDDSTEATSTPGVSEPDLPVQKHTAYMASDGTFIAGLAPDGAPIAYAS